MRQKLHLILNKDKYHFTPMLEHALLTKDEIVATDAHVLLIHKTKEVFEQEFIDQIPEGRWLLTEACLKAMNKKGVVYSINNGHVEVVDRGGKLLFPLLKEEDVVSEKTYPDFNSVIPDKYDGEINAIGISPVFLENLRQAIDPDAAGVALYFNEGERAMKVVALNSVACEYRAIIMPMMINQ